MTKKDYELIANILAPCSNNYPYTKKSIVQWFANKLCSENSRFNKQKFFSACYPNNTITFTLPNPEYIEDWTVS